MRRKESELIAERNAPFIQRIKEIKAEHPFWGYRRTWAHLKYVDKLEINKKRVFRLMQRHELLVKPNMRIRATRASSRSKPKPDRPNQWWGIDMTKVMVNGFGWMYLVIVLDWYTKKVVGYYIGLECRSKHWLEALDMALNRQFPDGICGNRLFLMSDNGSQPTSVSFMKACRALDINQAFTSYNNPRGNADTERMFRTMKEELLWLREWTSPFELADALGKWITYYNGNYLHSALRYKSPIQFEEHHQKSQITPLVLA
jgi:putative transposase